MEYIRRFLVGLLGMLDSVVYELINWIYGLLMEIAGLMPFSNETFAVFANRVYVLLGLFMLFKVSFSLIKYIVNPDDFNDKAKGGKKMVTNILVVLVMIVITPMAFDWMRLAQEAIIEEGVVEKLILGPEAANDKESRSAIGKELKVKIFSTFYQLKPGAPEITKEKYMEAYQNHSVDDMIHMEVNGEPLFMHKMANGKDYAINYMFIISTVVGIFTAWIFLNFCIDIAIRTVKLGFLQLISPIPIISYIDPSSSKNGMFSKWLKEVGKTYADLFIRLAAVYFAVALISMFTQDTLQELDFSPATIFVILGILIFANQIPKLIGDLFGVKIDGNFSLNPMSKINSSPIAGAVVGGAAGLLGGAFANTASLPGRFKDFKKAMDKEDENGNKAGFMGALTDGNKFRTEDGKIDFQGSRKAVASMLRHASSPFSGLAGAGSAMVRGAKGGSTGKGSALGAGFKGVEAASRARNARGGGYNAYDKLHDRFTDMAGLRGKTGTTSELGDRIKANQQQIANYQRDEQSFSQQLADLARMDPSAYGKAFEESVQYDEKGDVARDKDGKIITKRAFENYREYFNKFASDISDADIQARAMHIQNMNGYANDAAGEARAMREAMEELAKERGMITEKQFSDYETVLKARNDADDAVRKLEKRNKELQGYLDAKSGKPKG